MRPRRSSRTSSRSSPLERAGARRRLRAAQADLGTIRVDARGANDVVADATRSFIHAPCSRGAVAHHGRGHRARSRRADASARYSSWSVGSRPSSEVRRSTVAARSPSSFRDQRWSRGPSQCPDAYSSVLIATRARTPRGPRKADGRTAFAARGTSATITNSWLRRSSSPSRRRRRLRCMASGGAIALTVTQASSGVCVRGSGTEPSRPASRRRCPGTATPPRRCERSRPVVGC